jgi:hypothetical protein
MSTYDSYETVEIPRRHRSHHHRHSRDRDRDYDPESRFVETRETYVSGPAIVPDPPYSSRGTDLIQRPAREDSDLSIEEVRRDFPPPGASATYIQSRSVARDDRDRYGPPVRSRSADRGAMYLRDPRDDRRSTKKVVRGEEVIEPRRRSLSRNQKILAAVGGAALAVGGKELWDRRENLGRAPEKRNLLGTAAIGAAGAFAGYEGAELYAKKFRKEEKVKEKTYMTYQGRDGEVAEYYSESEEEKSDKKKSRRKSIIEGALGLAGLGAAAKAAGGRDDRSDRSGDRRSRRRDGSADSYASKRSRRDRSRGPGGDGEGLAKMQQAAKAALLAGAAEAFRVRKEPGAWTGAKGKRILTAAIGAGGIDAAADRDPEKHSKRHILEAVVGGLAGNRLINGSRNELDDGRGSKRSRSRSRGPNSGGGGGGGLGTGAGLAALATAGLGAFAGKKLLDRSKSRERDDDDNRSRRRRSPSPDEYDSDRGEKRNRRRSRSVVDYARKGLAALGIGEAAEAGRDDRRSDRREIEETRITHKGRRSRRGSDDGYDDRYSARDGPYDNDPRYGDSRSSDIDRRRQKGGQRDRGVAEGKRHESDTDSLGSSSEDEKRVKKMRGKQFLTAGLATVATIHAAHNVYQSYEKRDARRKAVEKGQITPEEARKLKTKAQLQDLASIGIAALGIRGAVSVSHLCPLTEAHILTFGLKEWKEMSEMHHEYKEFEEKKGERHRKRLERQMRFREQAGESGTITSTRKPRADSNPRYASAPDLTYGGRSDQDTQYYDSGPYASGGLPAPPVGYTYDRR